MNKQKKTKHNEGKSKKGWDYYKSQPLKAILVHVPEGVYNKLRAEANSELRSLEKTVRKALMEYTAETHQNKNAD